jgi:hypothetical protein
MRLIFTTILLASCAFAGDKRAVASACGPDSIRFDVTTGQHPQSVRQTEAGKALVYVIEDIGPATGPVTTRIGVDGAWAGANHGDSWFSFLAEPGEHHLCANWQPGISNSSFLPAKLISLAHINAEAGRVYYFRVQIGSPIVDLEPVNSDEGRFLIASYPFSTSHPKK